MAIIKPFKCIRPAKEVVSQVAALPYDVYSRQEAKEEVGNKPLSFLNIDRAETQFGDEVDTYDKCVYQKAKELLDARRQDGTFVMEDKPCYFLYSLTMDGRTQTGLVACSSIDDYMNNVIKKHENTRADKEVDRINHVDICNAQTGPIFLTYRSNEVINNIVTNTQKTTPIYDFTSDDGVRHTVWRIDSESTVDDISGEFGKIDSVYIADGHHRAASAVKVGLKRREENPSYTGDEEFNYFLSVLFPGDELMILPYNRCVKDLNGLTQEEFIDKVSEKFEVEELGINQCTPDKKGVIGMYLDNKWYKLSAKKDIMVDDPVEGLDVSVLQNNVLSPLLGIEDPRTDSRIDFVGGIRGIKELERRCAKDMTLAFSMYPTSIQELFDVADQNRLMPPKSTWFEPKLRSGLFIHEI